MSCFLVIGCLLLPCSALSSSAEHPPEDQNFSEPHVGTDFPVGWADLSSDSSPPIDYRILYPAMNPGSGKDMAGNGPFPHVQFFIDSGESSSSYMDLVSRFVGKGYIVAVHDEVMESTDFDEILVLRSQYIILSNNSTTPHPLRSVVHLDNLT